MLDKQIYQKRDESLQLKNKPTPTFNRKANRRQTAHLVFEHDLHSRTH